MTVDFGSAWDSNLFTRARPVCPIYTDIYNGFPAHLHNSVGGKCIFAKQPHREALSVRHNEGLGACPPHFSHPCTVLGKNVPCSPLQSGCPCGCLAKDSEVREKRRSTAIGRPDRHNPKFAERSDVPQSALKGRLRCSARSNCRSKRDMVP